MDAADFANFATRSSELARALWPAQVLLAGGIYPASIVEPMLGIGFISGGSALEGRLEARIPRALLAAAPGCHLVLRWRRPNESAWRAEAWVIDEARPLAADWKLTCSPRN